MPWYVVLNSWIYSHPKSWVCVWGLVYVATFPVATALFAGRPEYLAVMVGILHMMALLSAKGWVEDRLGLAVDKWREEH